VELAFKLEQFAITKLQGQRTGAGGRPDGVKLVLNRLYTDGWAVEPPDFEQTKG
jgi:hypothetical protein